MNGWCDPCVYKSGNFGPNSVEIFVCPSHDCPSDGTGWAGWSLVSVGPSGVCVKTLNEILKSLVITDHTHGTFPNFPREKLSCI